MKRSVRLTTRFFAFMLITLGLVLNVHVLSAKDMDNRRPSSPPSSQMAPQLATPVPQAPTSMLSAEKQTVAEGTSHLQNTTTFWPDTVGSWAEWATVVVTFGAVLIGLRTLKAIRDQVVANRDAAEAARDNAAAAKDAAAAAVQEARAFTLSERAYVFAKVETIATMIIRYEGQAYPQQAKASFWNYGKTPAVIMGLTGAPYVSWDVPQQLTPTPADDRYFPDGLVIAGGHGHELSIEINLTEKDIRDLATKTKKLYCAGYIKYKDILKKEWRTGYCWEYLPHERRFRFSEQSSLNYFT